MSPTIFFLLTIGTMLITGVLFIVMINLPGKKSFLFLIAGSYFLFTFCAPIWIAYTYLGLSNDGKEFVYFVIAICIFRFIELVPFNIWKAFISVWEFDTTE